MKAEIRFGKAHYESTIEAVAVLALDGVNCDEETVRAVNEAEAVEQELLGLYELVDRNNLSLILEEQRLALSGLVMEEGEIAQAGCLAGAQGTVVVSSGCLSGFDILKMKMNDCTSSKVFWAASGPSEQVYDIMNEARSQLRK